MKQYYRRIFALLLVLSLSVVTLSVSAFAAEEKSALIIKDLQGEYEVVPGSQISQSDLFSSFKGVMPGDVCVETIEIRNRTTEQKPLRLSLCATSPIVTTEDEGKREEVLELLSMLSIRIWTDDVLMFDATADTTLDEAIPLGVIPYRDSAKLRVELTVPVRLDNRLAQHIGQIEWVFQAEDAGSDDLGNTPSTGDNSRLMLWGLLGVVSLVGAGYMSLCGRKRSK